MFNLKSQIPNDVLLFLNAVNRDAKGYDIYLCGGYLRDKYWNSKNTNEIFLGFAERKKPKDLDIIFIPKPDEDIKELPVFSKTYINYDLLAEEVDNVRDNVYRVRGIFNSYLSTPDIQFIEYDKYLTMEEVASDMDIDINQIVYCLTEKVFYGTPEFYTAHDNKTFELRHTFDQDRMCNRLDRMATKFSDYEMKLTFPKAIWEEYKRRKAVLTIMKGSSSKRSSASFID